MDYDPVSEQLVLDVLTTCDPQEGDADLGYPDRLRRLQGVCVAVLAGDPVVISPEQDVVIRQAVGRLDPRAGDAQEEALTMLLRLQAWVETELGRWTASLNAPLVGPSAADVVAPSEAEAAVPAAAPVEATAEASA